MRLDHRSLGWLEGTWLSHLTFITSIVGANGVLNRLPAGWLVCFWRGVEFCLQRFGGAPVTLHRTTASAVESAGNFHFRMERSTTRRSDHHCCPLHYGNREPPYKRRRNNCWRDFYRSVLHHLHGLRATGHQ